MRPAAAAAAAAAAAQSLVVSNSVRPHRRQPTRLPCPWDSPVKNTGVGCFLLQCMKVKSESEVAQSCLTLRNPMDCSLPGSSARGIFQARALEWGATAFSKTNIINQPHCNLKKSNTTNDCTRTLTEFLFEANRASERDSGDAAQRWECTQCHSTG